MNSTGPRSTSDPAAASGLTEAQARARLAAEGPNELPRPDHRTPLRIVADVLREPMLALLLGGGVVYLLLGDTAEALILLVFATLSIVITVVQETRTERVLEELRNLTSPRALVIRDGQRRRIAGRDVVRGDILVLAEGDRVPADALLREATDLHTDESLLTGESVPVRKVAAGGGQSAPERPGGDDLPWVYSGSLVVRGSGLCEAVATGPRSEIGRIGLSLGSIETEPPRLQTETKRIVAVFGLFSAAVTVLVVLLYGLLRASWLEGVLAGIALGMSMLPEEFPVVLTVFMAMGAWRISQARVLTRRAAAIEALGSATVLCTDKTGTLTENRMRVAQLRLPDGGAAGGAALSGDIPTAFHDLVAVAALASAPDAHDPMERAIQDLASTLPVQSRRAGTEDWSLVRTYPLRPELLAVTQLWAPAGGSGGLLAAAKGAPEAIAGLCRLGPGETSAVHALVDAMAQRGQRVLGVALAPCASDGVPESQQGFAFSFLGLVGLADPLRPSVPDAVRDCVSAGIRVVMITGDHPSTASAIAQAAGLGEGEVLSGEHLAAMGDDVLSERLPSITVFARVVPEQKLRIVEALKQSGEVVAMTGDGVNDAPSLKAAHIGIAMGGRGTDVAREASALVLLDDDFGSIVRAVRLGRRIYDNLRKAMGFIFAVHVPIAGLALLPLVFGLPVLFGPVHIAFLEMVIDPVCSLVFEAEKEEDDVMRRPPRSPGQKLFSAALVGWGLLQGLTAFFLVAAVVLFARERGMPIAEVRALAFFSLVSAILALVLVNRSFSPSLRMAMFRSNTALAAVVAAVVVLLATTMLAPWARDLFRFGPLHAGDLALTVAGAAVMLGVLEMLKLIAFGRTGQES